MPCPLGHAQLTFFVAKGIIPSAETDLLQSPTLQGKNLRALSTQVQMALLHTLNPFLKSVTPKKSHVERQEVCLGREIAGIMHRMAW